MKLSTQPFYGSMGLALRSGSECPTQAIIIIYSDFFFPLFFQAHASALKELQDQLDKAYEELSDMQFQHDQDKAGAAAQQEKLQQELQVRSCPLSVRSCPAIHNAFETSCSTRCLALR